MERAGRRADWFGDGDAEAEFERASDANLDAVDAVLEHGTDADKALLRPWLLTKYGRVIAVAAMLVTSTAVAGSAHA
jgi:hypothetical protein